MFGQAKPAQSHSSFDGFRNFTTSFGDLASGRAYDAGGGVMQSTAALGGGLKPIQDAALSGMNNNLQFLSQDPVSQLGGIENNDFYRLAKAQSDRQLEALRGNTMGSMGARGLEGSTLAGGYLAQLDSDAAMRDMTNRLAALDALNNRANTNLVSQNNTLTQLANLMGLPMQNSVNQMNTAFGAQDAVAMQNAQMQQQANMQNAQMKNQMMQSLAGAGIGAALTLPTFFMGGAGGLGALKGLSGVGTRGIPMAPKFVQSGIFGR